jgi:proline iminopeptidase
MVSLYPEIEPYEHGLLDVGDGHRIYWETCGNPDGKPALVLHGGPGSGCTPGARRHFDPARYSIVLFDQRNAGRSLPHAGTPGIDLSTNTTQHLIADIERLRTHLGIERWLLRGGSWGATLALAYAAEHPERVTEMVLNSVATTTPSEIDWITRQTCAFFPDSWQRFRDGVPTEARNGNLAAAYNRLLLHPDPAIHEKAARDWCAWEDALESAHPGYAPNPRYQDPRFRLGFARLVTHYWAKAAWIADGALLRAVQGFAGIPGVLIHGRLDLGTPLVTPWRLAQVWPGSELIIVDEAGHDSGHLSMTESIVAATDRFAR